MIAADLPAKEAFQPSPGGGREAQSMAFFMGAAIEALYSGDAKRKP